jgi:hypothetical protein
MTYGTGVLFRIFHECSVTPEGANDESAEESEKVNQFKDCAELDMPEWLVRF